MQFTAMFSADAPMSRVAKEAYNLRNDMLDAVGHHPEVDVSIALYTDRKTVTLIGYYHIEGTNDA